MRLSFFVLLLLVWHPNARAQPVLTTKQEAGGLTVYQDLKDKSLYYYAPGKLRLATDKTGRPGFQLVQLRFTGTGASGNQGEKRFLNLVQVVIWMDEIRAEQIQEAKKALGGLRIKLKPMPVHNIEAYLVMPMGDSDGRYKKVGKAGGLEGANGKGGVWTERAFTVRLDNHEAELLWDQVEKGRLSVSLAYAYYSEAIADAAGEYKISGDASMQETLKEELDQLMQLDSTPTVQPFNAGAFPIEVDPKAWPDMLRKVDINDEAPPAWGVLEVRCYDFANDLRPDLGMKAIEIEASGVKDEPVKMTGMRFLSSRPDQNTLQVKFPYAVKLTRPYRYRVIEYTQEGERREMPWITRDNWTEVLDITTPPEENQFAVRELEVELNESTFGDGDIRSIQAVFSFMQKGAPRFVTLEWSENDPRPVKSIRFYADKDTPVKYYARWTDNEDRKRTPSRVVGTDDYIYLSPGE